MIFRILFQYSEKEKDTSFIFFVLSAQLQISVSTVLLPKLISAWLIFEVNTITQSKVIKDKSFVIFQPILPRNHTTCYVIEHNLESNYYITILENMCKCAN